MSHISEHVCQPVKGHPPPDKSQIKTIMQSLVKAGLLVLCFSFGPRGFYSSKLMRGPMRMDSDCQVPIQHLLVSFCLLLVDFDLMLSKVHQIQACPYKDWKTHFATFMSFFGHTLKYFFVVVVAETCLFQSLVFFFLVWYFDYITNIY